MFAGYEYHLMVRDIPYNCVVFIKWCQEPAKNKRLSLLSPKPSSWPTDHFDTPHWHALNNSHFRIPLCDVILYFSRIPENGGVTYWMEWCHVTVHLALGCTMPKYQGASVSKMKIKVLLCLAVCQFFFWSVCLSYFLSL